MKKIIIFIFIIFAFLCNNSFIYAEESKLSCDSSISFKDFSNKEVSCSVKFSVNNDNQLEIFYKDAFSEEYNKLADDVESFRCGDTDVYFTNPLAEETILSRDEFNEKYLKLTNNYSRCPKLGFTSYVGKYYVVFEDSFEDFSDDNIIDDSGDLEYEFGFDIGDDANVDSCGDLFNDNFKKTLNGYMDWIRIIVPVGLIGFGIFDFLRAVLSSKEDEMKKAQQTFFKRLLIGVAIFFLPTVVNIIIDIANTVANDNIYEGVNCIEVDQNQ